MNERSRVKSAVCHQDIDKVPWQIQLTSPARAEVAKYYGKRDLEDSASLGLWLGNHFRYIEPKSSGLFHGLEEEVSPGLYRDGWGVVWDTRGIYGEGEWGRPANRVLTEPSLSSFSFPRPPASSAFARYPQFIEANKDYFLVAGEGHLFETAWALRGMENLLVDMHRNPDFVDRLLDGITDYYLALIEESLRFGVDAFRFGDDWGYQEGILMGPVMWRRFIKPRMAKMFAPIKKAGRVTYLHSDGKITAILEDLIEIGLDIYNPFQPEIMDVYKLKATFGSRLCFHGGIGVQSILPFGSVQEVRENVRQMINRIGKGGGYILGPSHDILADAPVRNIVALIEEVRNQ
jgi:uroporphyrinogen decarboxylase